MDDEAVIQQFMGDRPRSEQISEWVTVLGQRLRKLEQEARDAAGRGEAPPPTLQAKIERLKQQIAALREEQAITEFVEDSVRVTLAMGTVVEGMGEDDIADDRT